jgi:hypothetical protein
MSSWYNYLCGPDDIQVCRRSFDVLDKNHWAFKPKRSIPWLSTIYARAEKYKNLGKDIKIVLPDSSVSDDGLYPFNYLGKMTQLSLAADDLIFSSPNVSQVGKLGKEEFVSKYDTIVVRKVSVEVELLTERYDVSGKVIIAIEPATFENQQQFGDGGSFQNFDQICRKSEAKVFPIHSVEKKKVSYVPNASDGEVYQPWKLGLSGDWIYPTMYYVYLEYEDSTPQRPTNEAVGSDVVTLELSLTTEVEFYNLTEKGVSLREHPEFISGFESGVEGESDQGVVDSKHLGILGIPNRWFPIRTEPLNPLRWNLYPNEWDQVKRQFILIPKSDCSDVVVKLRD